MDEDSVCRCEIVGFGEIRASTIGASEHDEWYNVSINYKDGEGLFYTIFTYKEPSSSSILTILKKASFYKLLPLKLLLFTFLKNIFIHKKTAFWGICIVIFSDGNHEDERLLFKYSGIIYVNLLCQYFCQGLRTRGCVESEAGLCLSESAKQVFKTVGLSKWDTDNEDNKAKNNITLHVMIIPSIKITAIITLLIMIIIITIIILIIIMMITYV